MNAVIIKAELSNPPSEFLAFRALTMLSKIRFNYPNIIEVEQEFKDVYYKFLKQKYMWDFIEQFIYPTDHESGIRLDLKFQRLPTIQIDRINFHNIYPIIEQIGKLSGSSGF